VTTYQGYQLELHRILLPEWWPLLGYIPRYPVILQPGLVGTSSDFVMASDKVSFDPDIIGQNMGFELAKQNYDVWLSNNRGSEYGLGHVRLNPKNQSFWQFSFDEIAQFDTPAIVDYVRNVTQVG